MSYTILQKGHTISASEVNDNYYHIGQGDWMPKGGISLEETGSVYNLGSDLYKWNDCYVNNVYAGSADINTIDGHFSLIDSYTIDETNSATSRIEFSINGDVNTFVNISAVLANNSTVCYFFINGDSNTSNYIYNIISFVDTNTSAQYTTPSMPYIGHSFNTTTANYSYSIVLLNLKSGIYRNYLMSDLRYGDEIVYSITKRGISWQNSSDTVTNLVFTGEFNTGASIKIWGIT